MSSLDSTKTQGLLAALPPYAETQLRLHAAHAEELAASLDALALAPGARALDLACGDGAFTRWIASRVTPGGEAIGLDADPGFLDLARHLEADEPRGARFVEGDARATSFEDGEFDAVWCAQSLYSLPDPDAVLAEARRILRPGGRLGLLENDRLHYAVLPWPPELELALREAELAAHEAADTPTARFYVGRDLTRPLAEAGFVDVALDSFTVCRHAPLDAADEAFARSYLAALSARVRDRLSSTDRRAFDRRTRAGSADDLLAQPNFTMTVLYLVAVGRTAGGAPDRPRDQLTSSTATADR